jgi:hypothetical protein
MAARNSLEGSNPVGTDIFSSPDRPWGPLVVLLHRRYRVCFPGLAGPGVALNNYPHLAPRLGMITAISLLSLCSCIGTTTSRVSYMKRENALQFLPRVPQETTKTKLRIAGFEAKLTTCNKLNRATNHYDATRRVPFITQKLGGSKYEI